MNRLLPIFVAKARNAPNLPAVFAASVYSPIIGLVLATRAPVATPRAAPGPVAAPTAPTLKVYRGSATQLNLWWSKPAGAQSYEIRKSYNNNRDWETIAELDIINWYWDVNLEPGNYYYQIVAKFPNDVRKESEVSNVTLPPKAEKK